MIYRSVAAEGSGDAKLFTCRERMGEKDNLEEVI